MTHWKLRLAASAFTMLAVLNPGHAHAQVAAPAVRVDRVAAQLPHISVVTTGKGSPVILIPGLASPRGVWDGVLPTLARNHRVYLVQINGFAGDDPRANLQPGILDGVVADLAGFIARKKITAPAVVGHSLGGLVGLMLARDHPAAVGKLMVVDALPYVGDIFLPGATVAQVEPQAKAISDAIAAGYGKPANPAMAARVAANNALKPASQATVAAYAAAADARVYGRAMYEDMTTDLRPTVAMIRVPITLVYPYSTELPRDRADAFYRAEYKALPATTFVGIADAKHFVMLDQPAAFAAALGQFVGN